MKIKILHHPTEWSNVIASFLTPLYQKHFDIEPVDNSKAYDKSSCVIYTHWINNKWTKPWQEQGYKIFVDHLWDPWQNLNSIKSEENKLVLRSDGWFCRANEALWYKSLGYDNYSAGTVNDKSFLMLMNLAKPHRDLIWKNIQNHLVDAIYSYNKKGFPLTGSLDQSADDVQVDWQRYFNPEWYDRTKYSLVVESELGNSPMSHSEKALKPMAFKHPMVVWGPPNYLAWLREQGFQTFSHCIDESYDDQIVDQLRLDMLMAQVEFLNSTPANYFEDPTTKQVLEHNYNLFYDINWANQQFEEKLFNVLKEYVEQ